MKILEVKTRRREIGNIGERAAARMLRRKGYRVKERNYVACGHEVDLIVENRSTRAFVEVKCRTVGKEDPREPRPASAVTKEKQRGIISVARYYMKFRADGRENRFDVVEVYVSDEKRPKVLRVEHLEAAFRA